MNEFMKVFFGSKVKAIDFKNLISNLTCCDGLSNLSDSMIYKYLNGKVNLSTKYLKDVLLNLDKPKFIDYLSEFDDLKISSVCNNFELNGYKRCFNIDDYDFIFNVLVSCLLTDWNIAINKKYNLKIKKSFEKIVCELNEELNEIYKICNIGNCKLSVNDLIYMILNFKLKNNK